MAFSFTQITFTNGQTLTHTLLNNLQTNIAAGSATISADSITNAMLAAPHSYFSITVPVNDFYGTIAGESDAIGVDNAETNLAFPFMVPAACSALALTVMCRKSQGTNTATLNQNTSDVGSTATFGDGTAVTATFSSAVSLATSDTLLIHIDTSNGAADDGYIGGSVIVHCRAAHVSDA